MTAISTPDLQNHSSSIENLLDAADHQAATASLRYTHDEVFGAARRKMLSLRLNLILGPYAGGVAMRSAAELVL